MSDPVPVSAISTTGTSTVSAIGSNGSGGGKIMSAAELRAAYAATGYGPFFDTDTNEYRVGPNSQAFGAFGGGNGMFHVRQDSGVASKIRISSAGAQNWLALDRTNGSVASPSALVSGNVIGSVVAVGNYGNASAYVHGCEIRMDATENWSAAAHGCRTRFYNINNGTTAQRASLSLNDDGLGATVFDTGRVTFGVSWQINGDGRFLALSDNAYDIGFSATGFRPRNVFVGTLVASPGFATNAAGLYRWSSTTTTNGTADLGTGRNTAGVMEINSGTAGAFRDLILRDITLVPSSSRTLGTNGQFSIEMTSNTAGNLVYRGSDGTTRRMALTFV